MPFVLNGPGVEFLVLVIPCVSASAFLLYRELWTEAFALISLTISVSHVYHQNSVILPGTTPGHYRPKADSGVAVGLLLVPLAVSALSLSISPSSPVSEYFNIVFNLSLLFANVKVPLLFGRDTKEFKRYGFSGLASWVLIPAIVVKARSMFAGVSIMILSLAVQQTTLMLFVTFFKNSFTLGEAMVLSETLVLLCFDALIATLSMVLPSFLPFTFTIKRSPIHIFMHSLLFGMLLIGATLYQVLRRVKRAYSAIDIAKPLPQAQTKHIQLSLVFFSLAALIVIALIRPWTSHFLSGEEPFTW
ncbi:hypothetical protein BC829DRAFT_237217 [Chytridium lagenaria]|nr:hypothetical protein BC829DRAFT_237217 [Chytridium lagenaria]